MPQLKCGNRNAENRILMKANSACFHLAELRLRLLTRDVKGCCPPRKMADEEVIFQKKGIHSIPLINV